MNKTKKYIKIISHIKNKVPVDTIAGPCVQNICLLMCFRIDGNQYFSADITCLWQMDGRGKSDR